jgi:hypothetical protein
MMTPEDRQMSLDTTDFDQEVPRDPREEDLHDLLVIARDAHKLMTEVKAGFEYDPGHSDLDNEQPIHVTITLGAYRKLQWQIERIERAIAEGRKI